MTIDLRGYGGVLQHDHWQNDEEIYTIEHRAVAPATPKKPSKPKGRKAHGPGQRQARRRKRARGRDHKAGKR